MADKRSVKQSIRQLRRVKTWQLALLLILVTFLAATFLRLNNIGMDQRRAAVVAADVSGDREALQYRLYDLQRYVSQHMHTSTGIFELEQTYLRDYEAYWNSAASAENPNGNIYKKAQEVCAPRFSSWSLAYVQCTVDELAKYPPAGTEQLGSGEPRPAEYRHSFAAPVWSPDFAGFTVLVWIAIFLMILARLITLGALTLLLKYHYREL